jgi:hypothetical protein
MHPSFFATFSLRIQSHLQTSPPFPSNNSTQPPNPLKMLSFLILLLAPLALTQEQGISEIPTLSESSTPNLPEASSIANVAAPSAAASAVSSILAKSSSLAAASPKATSSSGAVPTSGKLYGLVGGMDGG